MSGICSIHQNYGGPDCKICNASTELLGEEVNRLWAKIEALKNANYPELAQKEIDKLAKENHDLYDLNIQNQIRMRSSNLSETNKYHIRAMREENEALQNRILELEHVLDLIASPMRPDGTWNRDRLACYFLAKDALKQ